MPDFSQLLRKPAGEAKRPPALPAGDYPAVIKSYELGDNNRNRTPYCRFQVALMDWPATADAADRDGIDLSKRQLRCDFYTTDDALWRLDEFIRSCGIEPKGRVYEEILPELVGTPVVAEVQQYLNQRNSEVGNQIGRLVGQR